MVYGAARVCKGINLRGREAYATVPNKFAVRGGRSLSNIISETVLSMHLR